MKTKNVKNDEGSSSNPKANLSKAAVIEKLESMRRVYKLIETEAAKRAFVAGCLYYLHAVETIYPYDLWTHLPSEKELLAGDSIGCHISVTRETFGLIA